MRNLLIITLLGICIILSCKKEATKQKLAPPTNDTIVVNVVGNGTVSPSGITIIEPGSSSPIFVVTAQNGYHIGSATYNGIDITSSVSAGTYQPQVTQTHNVLSVTFIAIVPPVDSLALFNTYLQKWWVDRTVGERFTGRVALQLTPIKIPDCDTDYYYGNVDAIGHYEVHAGAHPCVVGPDPIFTGHSSYITRDAAGLLWWSIVDDKTGTTTTAQITKITINQLDYITHTDPYTGKIDPALDYVWHATPKVP